MSDLRRAIGEWLLYLEPAISVAKKYVWNDQEEKQFWEFIRRAAVAVEAARREGMTAIACEAV
jgi:hypothetical protein